MVPSRVPAVTVDGAPASALELSVLGPVEASLGDRIVDLGAPKQRAVVALLALRAPAGVGVAEVIEGLWGESAPDAARASVYAYVSNLRAVLGDAIERKRGTYALALPFLCDAVAFEEAVDRARLLLPVDPAVAAELLRDALTSWRGLPYHDLTDIPGLQEEIRRLEELRLLAVELRIEADLSCGRGDELVPELRALVAEHPLRERFRAQLMVALYRSGRQAEALREYRRVQDLLREELGVHPSPELQDLELRILSHDDGLTVGTGQVNTERLAFLFTDIEGSTTLWNDHREQMAQVLARHDQIVGSAVEEAGGSIFKHTGDGSLAVFERTDAAATAAERAQRALQNEDWGIVEGVRVRMAIDVGDVDVRDAEYSGPPINRCARILRSAHGGQVLLSGSAFDDLSSGHLPGIQIKQLGTHRLRGLRVPERLGQLVFVGLPAEFPDVTIDAAAADLDERLTIGGLPGYELREQIGAGTWGRVFRAYQPSMGREVALRIIAPHLADHPSFIRVFDAHAGAVARLEHPHVVPLYDFWRDHQGAYLVTQLMRGGSLADAMEHAWDPIQVADLVRQVGSALAYAHSEGSVHGDIRPENVLLDGRGNAYVSDFGLGDNLAQAIGVRLNHRGSDAYRSPEARAGDAVDARTDVYSLAVLAWALLMGREPPPSGPLPPLPIPAPRSTTIDAVLLRGTSPNREERFQDVTELTDAITAALGGAEVPERPTSRTVHRNPFKGLRAFAEGDAGDYHGRSGLIGTLVDTVAENPLVAIVGPSGSGKSSAVHAGLIPRLRAGAVPGSEEWFFASFTPGPDPIVALVDSLRPMATNPLGDLEGQLLSAECPMEQVVESLLPPGNAELLLVIDQFEELFTLTQDVRERDRFIDLLVEAVTCEARTRVVLTLRADFYDRPLEDPDFAALVSAGLVTVIPPTLDELVEAIERPAMAVGLSLEPGLAIRIAGDVVGQPGGLPLLQYALTEMVERRGADLLTGVDYESIGTVKGAVARRAESAFSGLDGDDRQAARDIMLRLITVDEETDDTRRRVRVGELESLGHDPRGVTRVLEAFGASRLLSFDRDPITRAPTAEVSHEALLREWQRLRGWIDDEREALILTRRLRALMSDWRTSGYNDDFLLTGDRIQPFRIWSQTANLTREEREFLDRSSEAEEAALARRRRRRRLAIVSLSSVAIIAMIFAIAAFAQSRRADREAERALALVDQEADARENAEAQAIIAERATAEARRAKDVARARELAASAIGVAESDPQLAMLLALEALETQPDGVVTPVELRNALRRSIHDNRLALTIPAIPQAPGETGLPPTLVFAPDGSDFGIAGTTGDGGSVIRVYSTNTWDTVWESDDPLVEILALSSGGDRVLLQRRIQAGPSPAAIEVVSLRDETLESSFAIDCAVQTAAWSSDRGYVAVVEPLGDCQQPSTQMLRVRDTSTGNVLHEHSAAVVPLRLEFIGGPEGERLAYTDFFADPGTVIFETAAFERITSFPHNVGAVSPDGSRFVGLDWWSEPPAILDVETGAVRDSLDGLEAQISLRQSRYFSRDGSRLAIANESSRIPVWDVDTGALEAKVYAGQYADVGFLDEDTMVTAAGDGIVRIWDFSLEQAGELSSANAGAPFQMHGIQASDALGVVWVFESQLRAPALLFDPESGELGEELPDSAGTWPAPAGDAGILYRAAGDTGIGPLRWWSADTGETIDVEGCWSEQFEPCSDGSLPGVGLGMWSSNDGTEAGFLDENARFRAWKDGPDPVTDVDLAFEPDPGASMLMGFGPDWIVVRTEQSRYSVFDRQTGALRTAFELPGHGWIRFDRSGDVGVGSGFNKTLSVISTEDWSWHLLTSDLGDGTARGAAVSPSGDRVAVGVMDGFVRVFEIETGHLLDVIPLDKPVALHWLDDSHLAAGTRDGLWTVLTLDLDDLKELAGAQLARDFTPNECALYRIEPCG